jgi:DNA-directed RNA polymerase subunit RPC12/RpoP
MELTSVRCNHCGAPLEVGAQTRFVTCQFCNSQLEVKHTGSAAFTEVVQEIAGHTKQMASNLKVIELQNDLERLDREWDGQKMQYYVRGKNGTYSRPSRMIGVIMAVMMISFGLFFATTALKHNTSPIFPIFGFGFVLIAVVSFFSMFNNANGLEQAESSYEANRQALERAIETAKQER